MLYVIYITIVRYIMSGTGAVSFAPECQCSGITVTPQSYPNAISYLYSIAVGAILYWYKPSYVRLWQSKCNCFDRFELHVHENTFIESPEASIKVDLSQAKCGFLFTPPHFIL